MDIRKKYSAVKASGLALIFVVIGVLLFMTAGHSFSSFLKTELNTAVETGAPIYSYNGNKNQPEEGELKKSEAVLPSAGSRYGMITCEAVKLKTSLYYGDSERILANGAGQYTGSGLPGEGRLILIGGHDVGCFAPLEKIKKDDIIKVSVSYGVFTYRVTDTVVSDTSYITQKKLDAPGEELVLYTCYPFGEVLGDDTQRYYVRAEKVSGPVLVEDTDER